MTKYWTVEPVFDPDHPAVQEAACLIRAGEQVAFPTETVYGLGADATNTEAVEGIFKAKGRPSDNPLIVHIHDMSQLEGLVASINDISWRLADAFWPGPLTLVLPVRHGAVSPRVTAGLPTVAVRMPGHPVALSLIAACGCPIAAPSANRSGRPSPTLAGHVRDDLDGRIAGIIDGGPTGVGLESTVVEVTPDGVVHVLRPGGVSSEELQRAADGALVVAADGQAVNPVTSLELDERLRPKAPGMKYTHYAPKGRMIIVQGKTPGTVRDRIQLETEQAKVAGERTGVLAPAEHAGFYEADLVVACGSLANPEETARELFASLRRFDEAGVTFIAAEAFEARGIGLAVMNRLQKAAGHRVITV